MLRIKILFLLLAYNMNVNAQSKTDKYLQDIFKKNNDSIFNQVINDPLKYRLQIIYTQINRDKNNKPVLKNYYFNYDPELYFNPASMVKMPLAFLSLQKLNELNIAGLDRNAEMIFGKNQPWQTVLDIDTTAANGKPTIAHFIKRAFLVSENDPYNRMYQFLGQGYIKKVLDSMGFNARITRQFLGLSPEQNRYTNAISFMGNRGNIVYQQPAGYNTEEFDFSKIIKVGKAHMNRNDELVNEPFDFTVHNFISLESMQQMLQSVMFPSSAPEKQRFNLKKDDLKFLYQYLSQYPSETPDPKYDAEKFYDSYVKFFFRDSNKTMPKHIRVFNKVGWSYGFLTDVSYVADFKNKVEYMLSATVYVNSDEVLNDGKYDYNNIGYPFLRELGKTIYEFELKRKRKHKPDLSDFMIEYEKRDAADLRPALKDIDN